MHTSAFMLGKRFFELYPQGPGSRVLDVGSRDINGTLRPCAPPGCEYVGVDLEAGNGVDVVLQDPYVYPFASKSFDYVVSTSCFKHDQFFWLTFLECCRVLKDTGYLYLNVPTNGSFNGFPLDCWRFYPDSALALRNWGRRMLHPIDLVESFTGPQSQSEWNDTVMIFTKRQGFTPAHYLSDDVQFAHNIHRGDEPLRNIQRNTQDQVIIMRMRQELQRLTQPQPPAGG